MKLGTIKSQKRVEPDIGLGSLIDVVFILLIFFVVTSTMNSQKDIELERPKAQSATQSKAETLRVEIDQHGRLSIGGKRVEGWALKSRLHTLLGQQAEKDVIVVSPAALATERLVEVVDQCKLAGADSVSVAVEDTAL